MAENESKLGNLKLSLEKVSQEPNPPQLLMAMAGALVELMETATTPGAKHGLCTEAECQTCKGTIAGLGVQAIDQVFDHLTQTLVSLGYNEDAREQIVVEFNKIAGGDVASLGQDDGLWIKDTDGQVFQLEW